ncbi:Hypothetical predicted protein [Mytilus galloprovincialis]|uniref:Uncharacterized protein n=1 Tax=Mytilus galloprovincialis TaxID=29158 RepID=A0A8B6EFF7_MYTGA|nr:Hypothetical predicted protein [Mytilus galloprovincialis]
MEIAKASFRSVVDTCWEAIDSIIYRGSKQEIRDAIRYGSTEEVVHLVDKCNSEQVIRDAIYYCIELGNTDLLQCVLQRIDSSDKEGLIITKQCREDHSPLHIACKLGNQEAVSCLLYKGFLVNIVDKSNQTPLWVAISEGHHSVTEMLLANTEIDVNVYVKQSVKGTRENQNITVLLQAAILDDMKSVIVLCQHNPDTNVEDATGKTALHYTSCNGRTDGVRTLLHCGADINKLTKDFESPLYLACQKGHAEVARLLLESVGKLWSEAGLKDLLVDSGVYAGTTAEQMLSGKQFNRAVRGLTLVYEALMHVLLSQFFQYCDLEDRLADVPKHLWSRMKEANLQFESSACSGNSQPVDNLAETFTQYVTPVFNRVYWFCQ